MRMLRLCGVCALLLLLTAAWGNNGPADHTHDDNSGTWPPESSNTTDLPGYSMFSSDPFQQYCSLCILPVLGPILFGSFSYQRMTGPAEGLIGTVIPRRQTGEPVLPIVRGDAAYRYLGANDTALDIRAEAGYGPFAAFVSDSRLQVDHQTVDIVECMGSLRLSVNENTEVDLCAGSAVQSGIGQPAGFAWGVPVLYHPYQKAYGFEFRPIFSNRLTDLDLAAFAHFRAVSLKAGYRTQFKDSMSYSGPYLGLTARY